MDIGALNIVISADDNASGTISGVTASVESLGNAENKLGVSMGKADKALGAQARAAASAGERWQAYGNRISEIGTAANTLAKPIYAAGAASAAGLTLAAKAAIDFEDGFAAVKKTVEGTPEQLEAVKQSIIDMSTVGINGHSAIPLTTAELNELAAAGGQLGIQTENIAGFTETMAMLGTATNLVGEQGAATLARFMNVTNTSQGQISNLGSAIVDLGNNFATTEREIADMAMEMGSTAGVVGISAQDVLAYSTALSSMGIEAAAGGSAISRIWMDIQSAVSGGGDDLKEFAKVSGKTSEQFAKSWKNNASLAFQDFLKGLGKSEDQVKTLSDLGFANIRDIRALQNLASDKGFALLTDAINRSNTAWSENIALQREFDAKAETTASKMAVAKNNAVEAARSFGEVMLPTIVDVTGGLANFTQGLAKMDDGSKKALVNTALFTVGLAGATKGVTSLVTGVGNGITAIGKIKTALAAASPALSGVASAAAPVAIGIGAVAAAAVVGKAAYDAWYNSQYKWADGLSQTSAKVQKSLKDYGTIADLQKEVGELRLTISSPDSSTQQVEAAKARLDEIREMLETEYNLVINTDNSGLEEAIADIKTIKENELTDNLNAARARLTELKPQAADYESRRAALVAENESVRQLETSYSGFLAAVNNVDDTTKDYTQSVKDLAFEYGLIADKTADIGDPTQFIANARQQMRGFPGDLKRTQEAVDALDKTYNEYIQTSKDVASAEVEVIRRAALEGDSLKGAKAMRDLGETIKNAGLDMGGYAQAAALAKNGLTDFNGAVANLVKGDGAQMGAIMTDFSTAMDAFGATAQEKEAALKSFSASLTNIAHSAGLLEGKQISIGADGAIEIIDEVATQLESLEGKSVTVTLNADGSPASAVIDGVTYQVAEFDGQTGTAKILAENGQAIGVINLTTGLITGMNGVSGTGHIYAQNNTGPGVAAAQAAINGVHDKTVTITVRTQVLGSVDASGALTGRTTGFGNAKGTDSWRGGLAMVNDQKGIADPRELIIDKGRAFIPEGRNVVLPLSKGATIYTAAETKAIMRGIPHFAEGRKNSDYFTDVSEQWRHYTATHAVTATQELEKWKAVLAEVASEEKDIWDAEEQIYAAQVKINGEWREAAENYITDRSAMADWAEYGDDAVSAFQRVQANEYAIAEAGQQTWAEADKNVAATGKLLYDERQKQSLKWIEHEKKYNDMSVDDEIAAYQRLAQYTLDYYEKGLIDLKTYREAALEIDERYLDAVKAKQEETQKSIEDSNKAVYDRWKKDLDFYVKARETYGDWDEVGDSLSKVYARAIVRQQELLDKGVIGWEEASDAMYNYSLDMYKAASAEYDDILAAQKKEIDELRKSYSKQEQAMQESWKVTDRKADIAEKNRLLGFYENAVTDAGQQKYKELLEQKEQLERDEQLYQLQVKNNATLEKYEAEYTRLEDDKKAALARLRLTTNDLVGSTDFIGGIVGDTKEIAGDINLDIEGLSSMTYNSLEDVKELLNGVIRAINNKKISGSSYNDSRTLNFTGSTTSQVLKEFNNVVVTGLAAIA